MRPPTDRESMYDFFAAHGNPVCIALTDDALTEIEFYNTFNVRLDCDYYVCWSLQCQTCHYLVPEKFEEYAGPHPVTIYWPETLLDISRAETFNI